MTAKSRGLYIKWLTVNEASSGRGKSAFWTDSTRFYPDLLLREVRIKAVITDALSTDIY